jgi:uncharacterized protein (UPF0332 family)
MTKDERNAAVELRIDKARRAYAEAKGVVELGYWETIANRLYYAAFYAISALLMANGDTAQTHSGVRHIFGLKFIKTGILPQETGRLYHRLFSMRQTGDYDDTYDVAAEDVLPNIEPTGKLIDVVAAKAKELIGE